MQRNKIHCEIKSLIAQKGFTLTEVVNQLNKTREPSNHTSVQNVSNKLTRGTIKYSEVLEIAAIIGLEVSWVNK